MKELNHLKEVNEVYQAIDGELYGNNSHCGSSDSEMSFISNSKFMQTPKRSSAAGFGLAKSAMRTTRSSSNLKKSALKV